MCKIVFLNMFFDHFLVSVNIACFVTKYSILESTDSLSDHEPLFCYLDCCIDDLPPTIDDSCTLNSTLSIPQHCVLLY